MTFPVPTFLTQAFDSATTSHLVNLHATINAGDKLFIFFNNDTTVAQTTPSGWIALDANNNISGNSNVSIYAREADGTEGGTTVDVVTAAIATGAAIVLRITDANADLSASPISGVELSASNFEGATSTPDGQSVTAPWGADDNLFIPICFAGDDGETASAAPSGYSNLTTVAASAGANQSPSVHAATLESTNATENPGTWTLTGTEDTENYTLVVRGAAAPVVTNDTGRHHQRAYT